MVDETCRQDLAEAHSHEGPRWLPHHRPMYLAKYQAGHAMQRQEDTLIGSGESAMHACASHLTVRSTH